MDDTTPAAQPAAATAIALWPADVLARHLVSDDPIARTVALGMAVQPGAPIEQCGDALTACAGLCAGNALASQLAATALGGLPPARATDAVHGCLVALTSAGQAVPVRIAAAHAMFRLGCLPVAAREPVCAMLLDADAGARKVALLAFTPFAPAGAGSIARLVAATPPAAWTLEALQALARSAGDDATGRGKVEGFVMRSLSGAPLLPAGIAGYASLACLNPGGAAISALVRIASDPGNPETSAAALEALGELGDGARPAARSIAQLLAATDDPAREELLCRTLLRLRSAPADVPMARVLQRVQAAPDRSTAAHCMLLCLHPKEFAQAAGVVQQRWRDAGEALRSVLAQTYKTLTGTEPAGGPVAGRA